MKIYQWSSNLTKLEITSTAKLVGFILAEFYRPGNRCFPSYKAIRDASGFGSDSTISKALKELVNIGVININQYRKIGTRHITNCYEFVGVSAEKILDSRSTQHSTQHSTERSTLAVEESTEQPEEPEYIKTNKKNRLLNDNEQPVIGMNEVRVDKNIGISSCSVGFEDYKCIPNDILVSVENWLIKEKEGQVLSREYIGRLILTFVKRQGRIQQIA